MTSHLLQKLILIAMANREGQMNDTKTFTLRAVLSVITRRLLVEDIGDFYKILNWITGDDLFTHQLGRASQVAGPYLLKCFPEPQPASVSLDSLDRWRKSDQTGGAEAVTMWLAELQMMFPELRGTYEIAPLPEGWTTIDPMIEMESMVGKEKIIAIEV